MDYKSKIILIAGPTASGKSKIAINLAKKINGEIINADSMQVYKQLKILTARPSEKDQKFIKHHLFGIIDVRKRFSTGQWLRKCIKTIDLIRKRKKIPLNTTGVLITKIDTESPINYLKVGDLIVEAQKRNIKSATELNNLVNAALKTSSKTILIAVINDQNQKRYIGVKLK